MAQIERGNSARAGRADRHRAIGTNADLEWLVFETTDYAGVNVSSWYLNQIFRNQNRSLGAFFLD